MIEAKISFLVSPGVGNQRWDLLLEEMHHQHVALGSRSPEAQVSAHSTRSSPYIILPSLLPIIQLFIPVFQCLLWVKSHIRLCISVPPECLLGRG